jgi:hypothetical protein
MVTTVNGRLPGPCRCRCRAQLFYHKLLESAEQFVGRLERSKSSCRQLGCERTLTTHTVEELILTIDESWLLGKELLAFALNTKGCKDEVRTMKEEIETLGTEKSDLAAQIETLNEQNPLLQQNVVLIEQLIAVNTKLIAAELEKGLTIKREVEIFMKDISLAHNAMRMKLSYVKSKGNESFDTIKSHFNLLITIVLT